VGRNLESLTEGEQGRGRGVGGAGANQQQIKKEEVRGFIFLSWFTQVRGDRSETGGSLMEVPVNSSD